MFVRNSEVRALRGHIALSVLVPSGLTPWVMRLWLVVTDVVSLGVLPFLAFALLDLLSLVKLF